MVRKVICLLSGGLLLIGLWACERKTSPPVSPKPATTKRRVVVEDKELKQWEKTLAAGTYKTRLVGYGNPFAPFFKERPRPRTERPLSPLERWSLKELKLTGIVQKGPRRWALIEDPSGKGYFVTVGTRIGPNEGYIARIGPDYILVKEKVTDFLGNVVVRETKIKLRPTEESYEVLP